MLSNHITHLPITDQKQRQKLLILAFLTTQNDSIRGIYDQARHLCQGKVLTDRQLDRLKDRTR